MKKNEYISPKMEIVEMSELCAILAGSGGDGTTPDGGKNPNPGGFPDLGGNDDNNG